MKIKLCLFGIVLETISEFSVKVIRLNQTIRNPFLIK